MDNHAQDNSTALFLRHLTLELLKLVTRWDDPYSPLLLRIARNFTHVVEASQPAATIDRSTFLRQTLDRHQSYPDLTAEVINCVVDVNEVYGRAKVWLLLRDSGFPSGFQQERISLFSWRRMGGEWYWYRHASLHGQGPIPLSLDTLNTDATTAQRIAELAVSPETVDDDESSQSPSGSSSSNSSTITSRRRR